MDAESVTKSRSQAAGAIAANVVRALALLGGIALALWIAGPYGALAGLAACAGACLAGEWVADNLEFEGWKFLGWTLGLTSLGVAFLLSLWWASSVISGLTPGAVLVFLLALAVFSRRC